MVSPLLEWLPSDVTKKFTVYVWKNLTGQAGQLEMRLFIDQYISKHDFWEKNPKQQNNHLTGLLKVSAFLIHIEVRQTDNSVQY